METDNRINVLWGCVAIVIAIGICSGSILFVIALLQLIGG